MSAPRFTDVQLSAWVDGEGAAGERAEIEAWLAAHPDAAARVALWMADREALRLAFSAVAREPVPPALAAAVWAQPSADTARAPEVPAMPSASSALAASATSLVNAARTASAASAGGGSGRPNPAPWIALASRWPLRAVAAGATVTFVLGAALGMVLGAAWHKRTTQQAPTLASGVPGVAAGPGTHAPAATAAIGAGGWLQRAVFAHSVYTPEPRHAVEVKAQEEHLARWLTRRIEAPVKLFDLRDLGFELVGGRLLPDGPGKSAQLMYQDGGGRRVTVYLRKPEPGTDTAFRYEQHGALRMFYWVEDRTGFALVGDLSKDQLLAMARSIYEQDARLPAPLLTPPGAASGTASSPTPPLVPPSK